MELTQDLKDLLSDSQKELWKAIELADKSYQEMYLNAFKNVQKQEIEKTEQQIMQIQKDFSEKLDAAKENGLSETQADFLISLSNKLKEQREFLLKQKKILNAAANSEDNNAVQSKEQEGKKTKKKHFSKIIHPLHLSSSKTIDDALKVNTMAIGEMNKIITDGTKVKEKKNWDKEVLKCGSLFRTANRLCGDLFDMAREKLCIAAQSYGESAENRGRAANNFKNAIRAIQGKPDVEYKGLGIVDISVYHSIQSFANTFSKASAFFYDQYIDSTKEEINLRGEINKKKEQKKEEVEIEVIEKENITEKINRIKREQEKEKEEKGRENEFDEVEKIPEEDIKVITREDEDEIFW